MTKVTGFYDAMAALDRGQFDIAAETFREVARQGNARARFILGKLYHDGLGVPQDDSQAVRWLSLSAEQGYMEASRLLRAMGVS